MASERTTAEKQSIARSARDAWRPLAHPAFICLLLAGAIVAAFWPVTHAQFINYDDQDYVTENPRVQAGLTWSGAAWAFRTTHASNWHPLTWLSHMLDVQLFGKGPVGPHCINLLLHVANSLLLFLLLRRMTGAQWQSALVAALFALHPLHVESVAWVAERKDVLSGFFFMLTLTAYSRYASLPGQAAVVRSNGPKFWYWTAVVLFALGLMSKPMLVTLPFVMLLLDYWPLGRFQRSAKDNARSSVWPLVWEKIPFLALSLGACVMTMRAQTKAILPLERLPVAGRLANALVAYTRYLGKAFWPADLALPYVHPGRWPAGQVALAALILALLCLFTIRAGRQRGFIFTGWFWFLGTMVPVIGLVQVGAQAMADRYTYIPFIGLFILFVWGAAELCLRWRIPNNVSIAGAAVLLGSCALLTREQATRWHDSEQLFQHSAEVTKDNFIALANIGGALFKKGRLDEALEFYMQSYHAYSEYVEALNSIGAVLASKGSDEALEWFRKALALEPTHPDALFNLGNAMAKRGKPLEASEYFRQSLQSKPENFEARNNLGNALFQLGRIDEAIAEYRVAMEYQPNAPLIHKNLGEMLAAKGKLDEAITEYREALRHTNDPATHYSLGVTLAVQNKWDEAIQHYWATLRLSPTNAEAQYNLGYALRVKGRLDEAATHLNEAVRLRPDFPLAHYNLACVLADQGRIDEAKSQLNEALRQKPDYTEAEEKLKGLGGGR